jgi:pimeloyl-ACP methyl ester carboxylesterase
MSAFLRVRIVLTACVAVSALAGSVRAQDIPRQSPDSLTSAQLVSVGSHHLYSVCQGSGEPVVVLLTGITETFRTWEATLEALGQATRVCAYDRAGYGESEPGPIPRSGERGCQELRSLLDASLPGDRVVLLGHSLGAMRAILFAARFPGRVAGMVLVDPPPLDFLRGRRFTNLRDMANEATGEWERTAEASSQAGQERQAAFFRSIASEHRAMFSEDARAMAAIESLGDLPLVVIASGRPNPVFGDSAAAFQQFWIESSRSIAALSAQGELVVAEESGHHVHQEQPALLVETVTRLVAALRDGLGMNED